MHISCSIDFFDKRLPFNASPRHAWIALLLMHAVLFIALASPSAAWADWNNAAERIRNHPTWIYTPSRTMANGKHVLFIVLHGCDQTHTQIRKFGNLTATADDHAMVIAVPDVGSKPFGPRCWNYNGARDEAGHIADLVGLAGDLITRSQLNIDPRHVYVVGLSAGGAMALDVACKAPDVFAGVGAIAGPSVGSSQNSALVDASSIPVTNVDDAVKACRNLAGPRAAQLDKQIAMIAFGDMDRNGANMKFRNEQIFTENDKRARAGQIALVSVKWSDDNVKALQKLYGTEAPGPAESLQGGLGSQSIARKDKKPRIASVTLHNVGHAWPAGTGQPNPVPPTESLLPAADLATATRGRWIALSGINFISHAASWLIGNNARPDVVAGMPVINVTAKEVKNGVEIAGTATDSDGSIMRIESALLKETSGAFQQIDAHPTVPFSTANGSYSDAFTNLGDGRYRVQVSAADNAGNTASAIVEVTVGVPPEPSPCFTDTNFGHVQKGRAMQCGAGFACAKGSGDNLGLFNLFVKSSVEENPSGFFRKGNCPGL